MTNVLLHARAGWCSVRLGTAEVEILDDGVGGGATPGGGSGLAGLAERVAADGGVIDAGPRRPQGWRLCVTLAPGSAAQ